MRAVFTNRDAVFRSVLSKNRSSESFHLRTRLNLGGWKLSYLEHGSPSRGRDDVDLGVVACH